MKLLVSVRSPVYVFEVVLALVASQIISTDATLVEKWELYFKIISNLVGWENS